MIVKIISQLLKNLILFAISMFFIITITFFIFEIIPGETYDLDYIKNETVIQNIREKYNLDKPIYIRYFTTLKNAIIFDFGNSYVNEGRTVNEIIGESFPISACIGGITIVVSLFFGIIMGLRLSRIKKYKNKKIIILFFVILTSIPTFVLAALLQYFLGVKIKLLPVYGIKNILGYILPVTILSVFPSIFIARTLERKIRETEKKDFVIAAKARGVRQRTLITKYILRNSITPILSYIAPLIANLIVGSFIVESIFNIPGLGRYFITSVTNRDYPVVMGLTMFFSIILIITTTIFNIIISVIDYKGDVYGQKN